MEELEEKHKNLAETESRILNQNHKKEIDSEREKNRQVRKKYKDTKEELKVKEAEIAKLINDQEEGLDLTNMSMLESQKDNLQKKLEAQKKEMTKMEEKLEENIKVCASVNENIIKLSNERTLANHERDQLKLELKA